MQYKIQGNIILQQKGKKWIVKQVEKDKESAKKALKLLHAIDHGWKPKWKK